MPNLPQQLLNSLSKLDHFNKEAFLEAHQKENKITSIRLNPFKKVELDFQVNNPIPWSEAGFYLNERPSFTRDPLFNAGCYYVQEPGSMFIEFALKQTLDFSEPLIVLDACAAPGGKSTLINSLLNEESLLVSNEFIKSRADVLAYNLSKWGTCNTIVTNNDTQKFSDLTSFFDAVVIDAPCSGSGLFRKQPDAIEQWSEDNVTACGIRQQKILTDLIPSLKENGILVYSTCSFSVEENEQIVEWLVSEFDLEYVKLPIKKDWGIVETTYGYRFYPHLTQSEGFFCAVLKKTKAETRSFTLKKKIVSNPLPSELSILEPFLENTSNIVIKKNNLFHLLNSTGYNFLVSFEKQFYFKKAGAVIGEIKGKDMVPNHELALCNSLNKHFQKIELTMENALKFLRKESFIQPFALKGLVLATYKNQGIGWIKLLPNRINNYLPNELRILK